MSGKMITETTPSGVRSIEADFDLDIKTTGQVSVKFKLKGDIPENLKEKCIDKAFQLLEAKTFPENRTGYVCIYDVNQDEWEFFELLEFVRTFVKPKDDH